jgi:type I restriction enzyme, S subunit
MRVYFHRVCNAAEDGISRSTLMVLRAKVNYHKNFGLFTLNREEAIEYATKNSTGTSIPYAKWNSNMEKYKICVADRETLFNDFNKIVDPILEKFKVLTGENRKLIELRDWLLPMLMNGQVKVN